ncbi:RDD family protein [Amaricoccus tamworthensis]|uniref:RDD family protein n=1 Tax=Amaricoccus tamworthensis TaxID=57002 RepID=UPI003C7ACEEB
MERATVHTMDYSGTMDGLPDPDRDPQFYESVPSRRLAAWCMDIVIIALFGIPLATLFGLVTLGFGFALFPFIMVCVGFIYRFATLANRSATWGMRFMGIEFRRQDGNRFDTLTALLHTAIYSVCFGFFFLQLASCLSILMTRYRQGLQDIILRTTAINRPVI